jgi:hypothetical protein
LKNNINKQINFNTVPKNSQFDNIRKHNYIYYNQQKNKLKYNKDDIYKLYEIYLHYSLKKIIHLDLISFEWIHPSEISCRFIYNKSNWVHGQNGYLEDSKDKFSKLGLDILKNGTYWPLTVAYDNNKLYAYEGNHRIYSIKKLVLQNVWPKNKKILCMKFLDNYQQVKFRNQGKEIYLKKPVEQAFPFGLLYGDENCKQENFEKIVKTNVKANGAEFIDKKNRILKTKIRKYSELLFSIQAMPNWMTDIFYSYQKENGKRIEPSPIINNKSLWEEFVN